jgi:hypothetical protein
VNCGRPACGHPSEFHHDQGPCWHVGCTCTSYVGPMMLALDIGPTDPTPGPWVSVSSLLGHRIPSDAAQIIDVALQRLCQLEGVDHPWQALELLAADYLAGAPK